VVIQPLIKAMKNFLFVSLASLSLAVASRAATETSPASAADALPVFAVNADRELPVEKQINTSLDALRASAKQLVPMVVELNALGIRVITPAPRGENVVRLVPLQTPTARRS
jgi:hypothetical protein